MHHKKTAENTQYTQTLKENKIRIYIVSKTVTREKEHHITSHVSHQTVSFASCVRKVCVGSACCGRKLFRSQEVVVTCVAKERSMLNIVKKNTYHSPIQ